MKTFIVKVADNHLNARDIKEYIWQCNSELTREDIIVEEA